MTNSIRFFVVTGCFATLALAGAFAKGGDDSPTSQVKPVVALTETEKKAVEEFQSDVKEYVQLHNKLAATLPRLPEKDATPEQIDQHRRELAELIRKERKDAKQGEFFTPTMVALIKRTMGETLDGGSGKEVKKAIVDTAPPKLLIAVNERYPEGAPMSTMPMELLSTLPELDKTVEYRILSNQLILVDAPAQIILDVTPDVMK